MIYLGGKSPTTRDEALEKGFEPQPGDGEQPALTAAEYDALPADHPTKVRTARWAHQGSPDGCADCGVRCSTCGDRMCEQWGPAPLVRCSVHPTCEDCDETPTCRECLQELRFAHEGSDW